MNMTESIRKLGIALLAFALAFTMTVPVLSLMSVSTAYADEPVYTDAKAQFLTTATDKPSQTGQAGTVAVNESVAKEFDVDASSLVGRVAHFRYNGNEASAQISETFASPTTYQFKICKSVGTTLNGGTAVSGAKDITYYIEGLVKEAPTWTLSVQYFDNASNAAVDSGLLLDAPTSVTYKYDGTQLPEDLTDVEEISSQIEGHFPLGYGSIARIVTVPSQSNWSNHTAPISVYLNEEQPVRKYDLTLNFGMCTNSAGVLPRVQVTEGQYYTLPSATQLTRDGYQLVGWYYKDAVTVPGYDEVNVGTSTGKASQRASMVASLDTGVDPILGGEKFTPAGSAFEMPSRNVTLYAVWAASGTTPYTARYYKVDGNGELYPYLEIATQGVTDENYTIANPHDSSQVDASSYKSELLSADWRGYEFGDMTPVLYSIVRGYKEGSDIPPALLDSSLHWNNDASTVFGTPTASITADGSTVVSVVMPAQPLNLYLEPGLVRDDGTHDFDWTDEAGNVLSDMPQKYQDYIYIGSDGTGVRDANVLDVPSATDLKRPGYELKGWYYAEQVETADYGMVFVNASEGDAATAAANAAMADTGRTDGVPHFVSVEDKLTMPNHDVNLYAVWMPVPGTDPDNPDNPDNPDDPTIPMELRAQLKLVTPGETAKGVTYDVFKLFNADIEGDSQDPTAPKASNIAFAKGFDQTLIPAPSGSGTTSSVQDIVDRATAEIGKPYKWGQAGPDSYDSSGLVSYAVSGRAGDHWCTSVTISGWEKTTDPQPGDICATSSYCGIYIGNDQMIAALGVGRNVETRSVMSDMEYYKVPSELIGSSVPTVDLSNPQDVAEYISSKIAHAPGVDLDASSFGMQLARNIRDAGMTATQVTADSPEFAALSASGYYLIIRTSNHPGSFATDTAATSPIFAALKTGENTIVLKTAIPSLVKQIQEDSTGAWGDEADHSLDQDVPYRLIGSIAENLDSYSTYRYAFHDSFDTHKTQIDPDSVRVSIAKHGNLDDRVDVTPSSVVVSNGKEGTVTEYGLYHLFGYAGTKGEFYEAATMPSMMSSEPPVMTFDNSKYSPDRALTYKVSRSHDTGKTREVSDPDNPGQTITEPVIETYVVEQGEIAGDELKTWNASDYALAKVGIDDVVSNFSIEIFDATHEIAPDSVGRFYFTATPTRQLTSLDVTFDDLLAAYPDLAADDKVVVDYVAKRVRIADPCLGESGKIVNSAYLEYSNNPMVEYDFGKTKEVQTTDYTYSLAIYKQDASTALPLEGVQFVIKNSSGAYMGYDVDGNFTETPGIAADEAYKWSVNSFGMISLPAVDADVYTITEVSALDHYMPLISDFIMTIDATERNNVNVTVDSDSDLVTAAPDIPDYALQLGHTASALVKNIKWVDMPSTGGYGTAFGLIVGIVLLSAAAANRIHRRSRDA